MGENVQKHEVHLIKDDHKEVINYEDPISIIRSSLNVVDKKVNLRIMIDGDEQKIKKLKKSIKDKKAEFNPRFLTLFLAFYVFFYIFGSNQELGFSFFMAMTLSSIIKFYSLFKGGSMKGTEDEIKKLEKNVKKLNGYIKMIDKSQ